MTAGSPHAHHTDAVRMTAAHTQRIARRFAEGQSADRIALTEHCTRARVLAVADAYGWVLDAAGILPRPQRPAVTPGRPVPAQAAGMGPAPATRPLPPLPGLTAPAPPRYVAYCKTFGCDNKAKKRGWCLKCYMRERRAA